MPRKTVIWTSQSKAQLRAVDTESALRILHAIDDYLDDGGGDVKKLSPPRHELRLRVGDYRVFFLFRDPLAIEIVGVKHRRDAYR